MIGRDIERVGPETMMPHLSDQAACPAVENWPDDEFARWVVSHRDDVKTLVCGSLHYRDTVDCTA
jgi:hypothetical protein